MAVDADEMLNRAKSLEAQLDERQRRYCAARAAGMLQREAAEQAGYSEGSAHVTGSRLDARPDIAEYTQLLRSGYISRELSNTKIGQKIIENIEDREAFNVEMEALFQRLVRADIEAAFPDPSDYFEMIDGQIVLRDFDELTPDQRSRIVGYKLHNVPTGEGTARTEVILQLMDPAAARVRLYKILGVDNKTTRVKLEKDKDGEQTVEVSVNEGGLTKKTAEDMRREIFGIKQ